MIQTVSIIGLGYVGLPSAALMARAGHRVLGVDVDARLISELSSGHCRLDEVDVKKIVEDTLADGTLTVSTVMEPSDVFVICVPTPITSGQTADLSMVRSAMKAVCKVLKTGDMVILESTSPIGTTDNVIAQEVRNAGFDPLEDLDICHCPERVFPGNTIREIVENDRLVGGLTERACLRASEFYGTFCKGKVRTSTPANVEFAKLMENTYRDVNIALANVFSHIAEQADCDVLDVISMANQHPRVNVHNPGPGVGGHCIPVDPWFLIERCPVEADFLHQARLINDGQARHLVDRAEAAGMAPVKGPVSILGAAYRGDIDDARNTPTENLIQVLEARGYTYKIHDPHVSSLPLHDGRVLKLSVDLPDVLSKSQAAFLMTAHQFYKTLEPKVFESLKERIIIDGCRIIDIPVFVASGFRIIPVGQKTSGG